MGFSSFDKQKRRVNWFAWAIIGFIAIAIIGVVATDTQLRAKGYTRIHVPDTKGSYSTYYCKNYREENGCVIFKDNMGWERKICGTYQIVK